jgi:hypothetical protein
MKRVFEEAATEAASKERRAAALSYEIRSLANCNRFGLRFENQPSVLNGAAP